MVVAVAPPIERLYVLVLEAEFSQRGQTSKCPTTAATRSLRLCFRIELSHPAGTLEDVGRNLFHHDCFAEPAHPMLNLFHYFSVH